MPKKQEPHLTKAQRKARTDEQLTTVTFWVMVALAWAGIIAWIVN